MKTVSDKTLIFSLVFVGVIFFVYSFFTGETNKKEYDTLLNQKGSSKIDTYTRTNFGFGLELSDKENEKFNITCLDSDSPRSIGVKMNSSYLSCSNSGVAFRVFLGWKGYSYDRLAYAKDVATTVLKIRGKDESGDFVCVEDRAFPWTEKIPATISDCYIKTGDTTLYYSVLFLYPAKIRELSPTIIIANISITDPTAKDKLRDFIRRVKYIPTPVSFFDEVPSLKVKVAYAGGGGGGGAGAGAGSCGAGSGSAGCGGSAGSAGGGDGGDGGGYSGVYYDNATSADAGFITTPVVCNALAGQSCSSSNACGQSSGTIACDGSCSAVAPALPGNFGMICLASNVCGQSNQGTIGCDGTCTMKEAPPTPGGYGVACQSAPNSCGQKATGIIGCVGLCTAIVPSDLNCATCGNNTCNITENNSNCPVDCPYVNPEAVGSDWSSATEWILTASPNPIFANTRTTVSWSVSGATGCTLVGVGAVSGKETDRFVGGPALDYQSSKLQENTDFTLTCSNAYSGRKDSKSVTVKVRTIKVQEF